MIVRRGPEGGWIGWASVLWVSGWAGGAAGQVVEPAPLTAAPAAPAESAPAAGVESAPVVAVEPAPAVGVESASAAVPPAAGALDPATAETLYRFVTELRIGGFGGWSLRRGGRDLEIGFTCSDCGTFFAGSPRAVEAADTFGTLQIAGTVINSIGSAALVVGASLPLIYLEDGTWFDDHWDLFTGLVVVGTLVSTVGVVLLGMAPGYLSDAVGYYNEDVFGAARLGGVLDLRPLAAPLPGGAALGVGGRF